MLQGFICRHGASPVVQSSFVCYLHRSDVSLSTMHLLLAARAGRCCKAHLCDIYVSSVFLRIAWTLFRQLGPGPVDAARLICVLLMWVRFFKKSFKSYLHDSFFVPIHWETFCVVIYMLLWFLGIIWVLSFFLSCCDRLEQMFVFIYAIPYLLR